MTISAVINRVSTNGNGVTTAFPFAYPFHAQADLVVISTVILTGVQTVKALTTDYTISGSVDALGHYSSGGTVNFLAAPASTERIAIYRDPALIQDLDLADASSFPAESLESQLDYVTLLVQRVRDLINRSLRQPEGDSADIDRLPSKVDRASMYLGFDSDGDPIALDAPANTTAVSAFMATVLDDASAALARATLAAAGSGLATASGLTLSTAKLLGRTTVATGAVEEIAVGTDLSLAAGTLGVQAATTALAGKVELATQAEVDAMTDTSRVLTPNHNLIVQAASQASTSGTTIDFSSIPAGVKRITIALSAVSTNGTSNLLVQLKVSGAAVTTGYNSLVSSFAAAAIVTTALTAGFGIAVPGASSDVLAGSIILTNLSGNTWAYQSVTAAQAANRATAGGGAIALAGVLDGIRITMVNGTDTFDAGTVNISYER